MSATIQDMVTNTKLEASVYEKKPKVMFNTTTGEWVETKCHHDNQFACAGREEACNYVGQPIHYHFKGQMNPPCNWVKNYLEQLDGKNLNCR